MLWAASAMGCPWGAIYYDLPGGGQNQYETLEEAVKRECLEETGYAVTVDRLAAVYEEISINNRIRSEFEDYAHKVHFVFICCLAHAPTGPTTEKDRDMLESEWVEIKNIHNIFLCPPRIHAELHAILQSEHTVYLGAERAP